MKDALLDDILHKAYDAWLGKFPKQEIIEYAMDQMNKYGHDFVDMVEKRIQKYGQIAEERCHITKIKKNFLIELHDLYQKQEIKQDE